MGGGKPFGTDVCVASTLGVSLSAISGSASNIRSTSVVVIHYELS